MCTPASGRCVHAVVLCGVHTAQTERLCFAGGCRTVSCTALGQYPWSMAQCGMACSEKASCSGTVTFVNQGCFRTRATPSMTNLMAGASWWYVQLPSHQMPALLLTATVQMPNGDRYAGYFKDGLRQGRGTLLYKDVKMLYNKLSLKTRYTGRRMYEGLWRAGDIRARNVHTDLDGDSPFFTTNNRSERFPELFVLNKSQTDEFYRRKKARKIKREEELAARLAREKTLWVTFNRDRQCVAVHYACARYVTRQQSYRLWLFAHQGWAQEPQVAGAAKGAGHGPAYPPV